jgi:hypothetical protein
MPEWSGELLVAGCLRPWAERVVDVVRPLPGERCLDVLSDGTALRSQLHSAVGDTGSVRVVGDDIAGMREHRGVIDVAVSLFGLAHAADPAATLAAMHASLRERGRLACVVWGGREGAAHEAALFDAVAHETDVRLAFVSSAMALGEPGAAESVVAAAEMRHQLRLRRLRDVVRFDGVDHLWAALVDERPDVSNALHGCTAEGLRAARRRCGRSLVDYAAADDTLRIPVEAVLVECGPVVMPTAAQPLSVVR